MLSDPSKQGPDRVEVVVAIVAVGLGVFVLVGSLTINFGSGYDRIGPRFFPYLIAAGLLVSGSFLAGEALRRGRPFPDDPQLTTSWPEVGILTLALVLSVILLESLGFVLTAALLFWLVARAFQSRRPWRDGAVALVLSLTVYLAFTRGLGLQLPQGVLNWMF